MKKFKFFRETDPAALGGLGSVGDLGLVVAMTRTEHENNLGAITRGYLDEIDAMIDVGCPSYLNRQARRCGRRRILNQLRNDFQLIRRQGVGKGYVKIAGVYRQIAERFCRAKLGQIGVVNSSRMQTPIRRTWNRARDLKLRTANKLEPKQVKDWGIVMESWIALAKFDAVSGLVPSPRFLDAPHGPTRCLE